MLSNEQIDTLLEALTRFLQAHGSTIWLTQDFNVQAIRSAWRGEGSKELTPCVDGYRRIWFHQPSATKRAAVVIGYSGYDQALTAQLNTALRQALPALPDYTGGAA